jgi:hypothetical protein
MIRLKYLKLLLLVVFMGAGKFAGANELHKKEIDLGIHWSEEKNEKSHIVTVIIKNVGEKDIVNTEMTLSLIGSKPNETASGKLKLNLSKGQEVKLPILLSDEKTNTTDFFGITLPLNQPISEIKAIEISFGAFHFSSLDQKKAEK